MNTGADEIRRLLDDLEATRPPVDERERTSRERFRTELDRLADPCNELADNTHVTASVIIVGPRGIVLHRHKRLGIWLQPGGHIDDGELAADAARREALEETGLTVTHFCGAPVVIHVDSHDAPKGHYHLDLRYLVAAEDIDPAPPAGESPDARWWSREAIAAQDVSGLGALVAALGDVTLRLAGPDDAVAIAEVYLRSFGWAYRATLVRLAHSDDEVRDWITTVLVPTQSVTVAIAAGVVVGFVATTPGWVDHLYVDPAWTGRGVGSQLLHHAQGLLPDGFDLWTFIENERACRFYEGHGLAAAEFGDGTGNEEGRPDVRFRWTP